MLEYEQKEAILNGVDLLDEKVGPTWPFRIDVANLDISNGYHCIIGQLCGHYDKGCKELDIDQWNPKYGICTYFQKDYRSLTVEWRKKIEELRNEREPINV